MSTPKKELILKGMIFAICIASSILNSQTYTFTTCGATGQNGPTQTQVNNTYSATNLNGMVSVAVQGVQQWTVPASGPYRLAAYGAQGGPNWGMGAYMSGDFTLTAGTVLKIIVGQAGGSGDSYHGSGGGGSFIATGTVPLVVAGGGGGRGASSNTIQTHSQGTVTSSGLTPLGGSPGGTGGGGGAAANGSTGGTSVTPGSNAGGSCWASGGGGFYTNGGLYYNSTANGGRAFLNNGLGGDANNNCATGAQGGFGGGGGCGDRSAGGGGYSGGGGGYSDYDGGGGGGSFNSGSSQSNSSGVRTGAGLVTITRLTGVSIIQTSSISCNGQFTGALSATASGGQAPYTYSWTPYGGTLSTATGLGAGSFTCTATDANMVVYTSTYNITQPPVLSSVVSSMTNITCYGNTNGAISVSVSGGGAPYSYTWSPTGGNSATATGLAAGNYSLFIRDAFNCNIVQTATLAQPSPMNVIAFATNPVVCAGGSSTLIAAGALTYTWSGGVTNGVGFTPTATNNYTVTGSNSTGCTATAVAGITVNPIPSLSVTGASAICSGLSSTLTVNGAAGYSWNTGATSSVIIVSPSSNSIYTVIGTSANGCTNSATKSVTVYALPTVTAAISNSVVCSGSPVVLTAGGALTYTWTGGVTNGVAFNPTVSATYTLIGTDANGCSNFALKSLVVNALPSLTISGAGAICIGNSATLTVSGASSYTWNTGSNATNITVSPTATTIYSVTGTGTNGCLNTALQALVINPLPAVTVGATSTVVCNGQAVTLIANGASSYTWQPLNISAPFVTVSPSSSTSYTVTGINVNGCINSGTIAITSNSIPTLSIAGPTAVCLGGSVTLNASGATTYTWSTGASGASLNASPLTTLVYTVTGSSNGCLGSATKAVIVNPLPVVTATAGNPVICNGSPATLIGNGAISYTWQPGNLNGQVVNVTPLVNSIYTVTGTDVNGCGNSAITGVTVNALPVISATATGSVCAGKSVTLSATGAISYTWNTGAISATTAISPLATSVFTVYGSSPNGCVNSNTVMVTASPLPTLSLSGPTAVCPGNSATLSVTGAASYTWNTGLNTAVIVVTPSATTLFTITGTGNNGCQNALTHTLALNPLPLITASSNKNVLCIGESASLSATGGITYTWSTLENAAVIAITPTSTTSYTLTGTDANGCVNTAVYTQSVTDCTGLGDIQLETASLSVFPNPNAGQFTVSANSSLHVSVINESGQIVKTLHLSEQNGHKANVDNLANGLYILVAQNGTQTLKQKIVIAK